MLAERNADEADYRFVLLEPTVRFDDMAATRGLEAHLFGRETGSWRTLDPSARARAGAYVSRKGIKRIFAINPAESNAKIVKADPGLFPLAEQHYGVDIHYGLRVDGIAGLGTGDGFWIASADCPTAVIADESGMVIATHISRDSMIVRHWLGQYRHLKRRRSVVANALRFVAKERRSSVSAFVMCGIGRRSNTYRFDDPAWGESNRKLYAAIDSHANEFVGGHPLGHAVHPLRLQDGGEGFDWDFQVHVATEIERLTKTGRGRLGSDSIDTFADVDRSGQRVWWSMRQGDTGRNGILVLYRDSQK